MKSAYRTRETETFRYNFKDTNSDIKSINIGSDIINVQGLLSNGANSNADRNNNRKSFNFKQTTYESEEKTKKDLENIVRKYLNKIYFNYSQNQNLIKHKKNIKN